MEQNMAKTLRDDGAEFKDLHKQLETARNAVLALEREQRRDIKKKIQLERGLNSLMEQIIALERRKIAALEKGSATTEKKMKKEIEKLKIQRRAEKKAKLEEQMDFLRKYIAAESKKLKLVKGM